MTNWMRLIKMNKIDKNISVLSKKIKNVRVYKSTSIEKLHAKFSNVVMVNAKVRAVGNFSGELKLPLKVEGELLRPGDYYTGTVTEGELRKAFDKLVNDTKEILLFTTHDAFWGESSNINDVVGKLFEFTWDNSTKSINFKGDIYDESTALKVLNKIVKGISAGFTFENKSGVNSDIEISEGSLTFKPHCKTASVNPVI